MTSRDDPLDWERVEALLAELLDLPESERRAFLASRCADEPELAAELECMLEREFEDSSFLQPPHPSPAEPSEGQRIGAYRLVRPIGRGGMATVWLAERDGEFDQRVAIKLVHPGLDSTEVYARFLRERQVLAALEHPGVARLVDGGALDDGRPFLAMELVEGLAIDEFCRREGLDVRRRIQLFLPVLEAVEYAHQRLVVHRDLKPSNVLIQPDGRPKLLDFGIAKVLDVDGGTRLTSTDARPMTPRYASPEQVAGGEVTTRSDIYSLGVMLFELLTGKSPYGDTTASVAYLRKVLEVEAPRPSAVARASSPAELSGLGNAQPREVARRLAGDLDWILLTALRKDPDRRYATVAQFAEDLRRTLAGLPVNAGPDSWSYRAAKFVRRHRLVALVSSIAAVLLVVATIVSGTSAVRAASAAQEERRMRLATQETLGFLTTFLTAPSPEVGLGVDTRVSELLEQAREQALSIQDPVVSVSVAHLLGATLLGLGEVDAAEGELMRGIRRAEAADVRSIELGSAWNQLAKVYAHSGRNHAAMAAFDRCIEYYESLDPAEVLFVGPTRRTLEQSLAVARANYASQVDATGHPHDAAPLYRRSLEEVERVLPNDLSLLAKVSSNLGDALEKMGRLDEALLARERGHELALRLVEQGDRYQGVVSGWGLARTLILAEQFGRAEAIAREHLAFVQDELPPSDQFGVGLRSALAHALAKLGRVEEARDLIRAARADFEGGLDAFIEWTAAEVELAAGDHEEAERVLEVVSLVRAEAVEYLSARIVVAYAECLEQLGQPAGAGEQYRIAVELFEEIGSGDCDLARRARVASVAGGEGGGDEGVAFVVRPVTSEAEAERQHARASLLEGLAHYPEAIAVYAEVLRYREATAGSEALETNLTRFLLGAALLESGQVERGTDRMALANEHLAAALGPEHPLALMTGAGVGLGASACGRLEEALRRLDELERIAEEHLIPWHPAIYKIRFAKAWTLADARRWEEAGPLAGQLLERVRLTDDPQDEFSLQRIRAECLAGLGRVREAEDLMAEWSERAARELRHSDWDLGRIHRTYAELLSARGRPAEALEAARASLAAFRRLGGAEHPEARRTSAFVEQLARQ